MVVSLKVAASCGPLVDELDHGSRRLAKRFREFFGGQPRGCGLQLEAIRRAGSWGMKRKVTRAPIRPVATQSPGVVMTGRSSWQRHPVQ